MLPDRWLKRLLPLLALGLAALYAYEQDRLPTAGSEPHPASAQTASHADATSWRAGEWIVVEAEVSRLLSDDSEGSRHQRFIITLPDRHTLLVAHNIDLAERVPVGTGDRIRLRGRFEPGARGGVVHWTHHDPEGLASAGWIEHQGRRYQ